MTAHDPLRLAGSLREPLANDKASLAFLLGAGCPCALRDPTGGAPLIPAIKDLTSLIKRDLVAKHCGTAPTLLQHFLDDGRPDATVEDVLSHIRTLREVAGKGSVRNLTADELDTLDRCICDCIVDVVDQRLPAGSNAYRSLAAWARQAQRTSPLEFFTTNYDTLLEEALEEARVPYFDGFIGSRRTFFDADAIEQDRLPAAWARVWKIHGSIHWYQTKDGAVYRSLISDGGERRVIHPSNLKYAESRRMPYLAMLDRLRAFLCGSSSFLVTIGYSFGDQHLNEVILHALQTNPTTTVAGLLYGPLSDYSAASMAAASHRNLILVAKDKGVLGGQEGTWCTQPGATSPAPYIARPTGPAGASPSTWEVTLGDFANLAAMLADIAA